MSSTYAWFVRGWRRHRRARCPSARRPEALMHLHILGICGTFMGGIAAIAKAAGHTVTGCDANVYPPMSTQLAALGIGLDRGLGRGAADGRRARRRRVRDRQRRVARQSADGGDPRRRPAVRVRAAVAVRERAADRWVLAVAGTHGKTTTTAMLASILEDAGLAPGFLIGGVPVDFQVSARLTDSAFFVIEADEYDTAFFDKRSKFVHYRPRTAILNNLEYDHADIFPDLAAIETQFHHLVRMVPGTGRIVANGGEASRRARARARLLERGRALRLRRSAGHRARLDDRGRRHDPARRRAAGHAGVRTGRAATTS